MQCALLSVHAIAIQEVLALILVQIEVAHLPLSRVVAHMSLRVTERTL